MLQTIHEDTKYRRPSFARAKPRDSAVERAGSATSSSTGRANTEFGDSGELRVEEIVAKKIDYRDQLAYRRLMGEQLTLWEQAELAMLNAFVDVWFTPPKRPSKAALDAAREIRRLLRK